MSWILDDKIIKKKKKDGQLRQKDDGERRKKRDEGKSLRKRAGPEEMDYKNYQYRFRELVMIGCKYVILFSFVFYLFYRTKYVLLVSLPFACFMTCHKREQLGRKRKWKLNLEFKDGLQGISAALEAGYSVENAIKEAVRDLEMMYPPDSDIIREFCLIIKKHQMNVPLTVALSDFAERSGVEDIENFSEVFATAARTGGNLIKIVKNTSKNISEKIEVKREIETMITGKKFEAYIMSTIPCVIILYLWIFSPEFLDSLYGNVIGAAFMTVMLLLYGLGIFIFGKITDIQM